MTRDEILASHPLVPYLQDRGYELFFNNTRCKRCPVKEHDRKDAVHITGDVWFCHVCNIGGSVIDHLMHEKGIQSKEAMQELSNGRANLPAMPPPIHHAPAVASKVVATYAYESPTGKLLYRVERLEPGPDGKKKSFRQSQPDGNGGWIYSTSGIERVLYHLPEVLNPNNKTVWITEGEKDADTLRLLGFCATTADGGAGNFKCNTEPLAGKEVILCGDNDEPGDKHMTDVATKLNGVAKKVSRVRVPAPSKDISDYVEGFGDMTVAAEACRILATEADVIHGPLLRPLMDIVRPEKGDPDELIKHRYLCRGGMMMFVAPSGVGKSSFIMQSGILWTLGRPAFGMTPTRPLKIVVVQAENDDGDLAEMRDGVIGGMGLDESEIELVLQVIQFRTEFLTTGAKFCALVDRILKESGADIIVIDPVLAYLGGSMNDQETVGGWLRNHMMPTLKVRNAAAILVHHTNKPPSGKEKPDWQAGELSYLGGGSAEFVNACRAVMCIQSIGSHSVYKLVAAKRGSRLGWRDVDGGPVRERHIAHATEPGVICWREVTDAEAAAVGVAPASRGPKVAGYMECFPKVWGKSAREALLNATELRQVFIAKKWDYRTEPSVRRDAMLAGVLASSKGDGGSEKLFGRPDAVQAYQRE